MLLFMKSHTLIDLTHPLSETTQSWGGGCITLTTTLDYKDCTSHTQFRLQSIALPLGIGTHIDSPAHCIPGGATVSHIPLETLHAPCFVIDVTHKSHAHYRISYADIIEFESLNGVIAEGGFVLFSTGWSQRWNNQSQYHNNLQFPTLSPEAAQLLVTRNICGIGIDTLGPDLPGDRFPVHETLLSAGIYIVENVAHAEKLPATGSYIFVFPLLIESATESPARVVAFTPQEIST